MSLRSVQILAWLKAHPGWHGPKEIGRLALRIQNPGSAFKASIGSLKKLAMTGQIEMGMNKAPGTIKAFRAKES